MHNPNSLSQSGITLLRDIEWSLIDGELCLVSDFASMMGSTVKEGAVISNTTNTPYASIVLSSKKAKNMTGFITHKIDFANFWKAFKERGINDEEEVLVYWTAKHYKYKILQIFSNFFLNLLGTTPFPKMIIMICPKGTYNSCLDGFPLTSNEKVTVFVYGLMSTEWWIPDVIK